jgi:hypothetical protein
MVHEPDAGCVCRWEVKARKCNFSFHLLIPRWAFLRWSSRFVAVGLTVVLRTTPDQSGLQRSTATAACPRAELSQRQLKRLAVTSVDELIAAITAYIERRNTEPKPFT